VLKRYSDLLHKEFACQGIDVEDGLRRIAGNCVRLCCQGIAIDIAKFKGEVGERICGKCKQSSRYQDAHAKLLRLIHQAFLRIMTQDFQCFLCLLKYKRNVMSSINLNHVRIIASF
jgi:hypothetical protein